MMDITDGLSIDLHRMMEASRTGAVVDMHAVPVHTDVDSSLDARTRLHHALSDGEDFELLLAISPEITCQQEFRKMLQLAGGSIIGTVTADPESCFLASADGQLHPMTPVGWQHL
jgi:thiamine-monophosphate kinase